MNYSGSSRQNKPYSDEFTQYLRSISKYPLLTAEEEKELAVRSKTGDKAAFDKLVNSNLRLVVSLFRRYRLTSVDPLDLVQAGNVGLIEAAKHFNPSVGCRFSTYAFPWIKKELLQYLSEMQYSVRVPRAVFYEISSIKSAAENDIGKPVTELSIQDIEKISELTDISVKKIISAIRICIPFCSLFEETSEDDSRTIEETIVDVNAFTPEEAAMHGDLREKLEGAMSCLTTAEADVIRERYQKQKYKTSEPPAVKGEQYVQSYPVRQKALRFCARYHSHALYSRACRARSG